MHIKKTNIADKLDLFNEHWTPKIIGELNGQQVKLAKIKGSFDWHQHEHEDEMFLVIKGSFIMKLRDRDIILNEGEFIIIPRGTEHMPVAEEEAHIMLFEPISTVNTGDNTSSSHTKANLDRI